MKEAEFAIVPDAETRQKIAGNIDLKGAVNAKPCDCSSCGSCRCTPCK